MTIVSPIFHAKIVGSITCGMVKDTMKPCLQGVPGNVPTNDCCAAIVSIDRQAIGIVAKQYLCECYKDAMKSYPYIKIINFNFPEQCHTPLAVPISGTVDCKKYI